jgi:hypothetical protein
MQMLEDRNLTSHTYNEILAERIYRHIVDEYATALRAACEIIQNLGWD